MALIIVSQTLFYSFIGVSNSLLKTNLPVFMTEIYLRVLVIAGVVGYFYAVIGFQQFIIYYGLVYLSQCLVLAWTVRSEVGIGSRLEKQDSRKVWKYALFSTLDSGASKLVARLDILMIGALLPAEYAAFYLIGLFIAQIITIPSRAITPIATPLIAKAWTIGDMDEIQDIYHKSSLNQMILGGIAFVMIWAGIDQLQMFLPEEYRHIKYVVLWLGLGSLMNISAGVNGNIILTSARYRVNFYLNLLLLVITFASNMLLIPEYGIEGAALATMVSLAIFNLLKYAFLLNTWKLQPFNSSHLKALLILGAVAAGVTALPELTGQFVVDLLIRSGAAGLIAFALIYFLRISDDLNQRIDSILRAIR